MIKGIVERAIALGTRTCPDIAIIDDQLAGRQDGIEGADLLHRMLGVRVVFLASVHGDRPRLRKKEYPGATPRQCAAGNAGPPS